uniref:Secreted protein n=1 Tax=Populus trichocarpa TaxID=3694 RepID=A9PHJ7_POPTR|nr:unknown [Populus trichocarpa]
MVVGFCTLLPRLVMGALSRNCWRETLFLFLEKENMVLLTYFMPRPGAGTLRFSGSCLISLFHHVVALALEESW